MKDNNKKKIGYILIFESIIVAILLNIFFPTVNVESNIENETFKINQEDNQNISLPQKDNQNISLPQEIQEKLIDGKDITNKDNLTDEQKTLLENVQKSIQLSESSSNITKIVCTLFFMIPFFIGLVLIRQSKSKVNNDIFTAPDNN